MGMLSLRKATEVRWGRRLELGTVYRIVGQFHVQTEAKGTLHACLVPVVAGMYQGQLSGDPTRHVFTDTDGLRYVVSSPAHTCGLTTARVYRFPKKRVSAARAA